MRAPDGFELTFHISRSSWTVTRDGQDLGQITQQQRNVTPKRRRATIRKGWVPLPAGSSTPGPWCQSRHDAVLYLVDVAGRQAKAAS